MAEKAHQTKKQTLKPIAAITTATFSAITTLRHKEATASPFFGPLDDLRTK